jgi:hypothetical protein
MNRSRLVTRKRLKGQVEYNDGDFAEVQTCGIEGIEKNLRLQVMQLHVEDTNDTPEEFRQRFPAGMWLDIVTTIEVTPRLAESATEEAKEENTWRGSVQ